jgi:hypothetical protein
MSDIKWPLLPQNIIGVNYKELEEFDKLYKKYICFLDNFNRYQKEDNIEFSRVIPPYREKCSVDNPKCVKPGSFLKKFNNKYFCWFHVNCN